MKYTDLPIEYLKPSTRVLAEIPSFHLPESFCNSDTYLEHLVKAGAKRIYGLALPDIVEKRLSFELDIIKGHKCADYFLIVEDLVRTARERFNLLSGPGRGCSAGSFVCYCLGITKVDPMKHDLLFERFMSPERMHLPDIDIDFEVNSFGILFDYLRSKYGEEHVMRIGTYQLSENKQITGYGVHACGIAMSKNAMDCYTPIANVGGEAVTVYDGHYIEDAGVIKLDLLDLNVLSIMHDILNRIKKNRSIEIDVDRIPIDDEMTLNAFLHGNTEGIFLFEHLGDVLRKMRDVSFEDLTAISTMYRPGLSNLLGDYIDRKESQAEIKYALPCMERYLNTTYGLLLYQEQLMMLVRRIANFSRSDSDRFRKAITRKKIDMIAVFEQKFYEGGRMNGFSESVLKCIWEDWNRVGTKTFNKAHAVCYTMIAFQMMFLKVNYPEEFMSAINNSK